MRTKNQQLQRLDLNLLYTMESLYRSGSVTKTAVEMRLTQSAISHSLSKLRAHFNDPLFIRGKKGLTPSSFALGLREEVYKIISMTSRMSQSEDQFDLKDSQGQINIVCSDYTESRIGSYLFSKMSEQTPLLSLSFRPLTGQMFPVEELERGVIDIALGGFFQKLPAGLYQQLLFDDPYVTVVRKSHPLASRDLTSKDFFSSSHAKMSAKGLLIDGVESFKKSSEKVRKVVYTSPSFFNLFLTVANSDLLLTAPKSIASIYADQFDLSIKPTPVKVPSLKMQMVWHAFKHDNPTHKWVRETIKRKFIN